MDSDVHEPSASSAYKSITCFYEMLDKEAETGLASRREMVNLLDAEPLLAYLVQNGVLSCDERNDILNEDDTVKQNILLLKFVEMCPNGMKLFTNVLRQTGQHYLANLVDDGIRIKALSSSGYLSKARKKGQVGLKIRVKSMKLQQMAFKTVSELLHKDWISLGDIQMKLSSIKKLQSQSQRSSLADPPQRSSYAEPIAPPPPPENNEAPKDIGCCFCCCGLQKSKNSRKKARSDSTTNGHELVPIVDAGNANSNANVVVETEVFDPTVLVVTCQPVNKFSGSQDLRLDCIRNGHGSIKRRENSVENLRNAANIIQEKCMELYSMLSNRTSVACIEILRYFEQDRAVLVLDTDSNDALNIFCVCTKLDQIALLHEDLSTGKLKADLEQILTTPEVLQPLGIAGVKLDIEVNQDDLDMASKELP